MYLLAPVFALAFMALSYVLSQPLWERAFLSDHSPVAWLSSAQLLAGSVLSWRLTRDRLLPRYLGGLMVLGLLYCALDEQFMLHEHLKYEYLPLWLPSHSGLRQTLSDLPLVVVGLGGAFCVGALAHQKWHGDRAASVLLLASLIIGFVAIAVDIAGQEWRVAPIEEGIEVLAESFFLAALLTMRQVQSSSSS